MFTDVMKTNDDITDIYACVHILQTKPIDLLLKCLTRDFII